MIKRYASLLLIGFIINLSFSSFIYAQDAKNATEKQKIEIAKTGVGGKLIQIRLKDKTKLKGYITEIKDDCFVLVNKKTAASEKVSYDRIKDIQRPITNFQKVLIGVGLGVAVFGIITAICVANGRCDE